MIMAYRKNYRSSRRVSRPRSRSVGSKMGLNLSLPFLAGVAGGLSNLDDRIPKDVTLVAATAPVRGLGVVKGVAQGIILGNVIQHFAGFRTGGSQAGYKQIFEGF